MRDCNSIKRHNYQHKNVGQWVNKKKTSVPSKSKTSRRQKVINEKKKIKAESKVHPTVMSNTIPRTKFRRKWAQATECKYVMKLQQCTRSIKYYPASKYNVRSKYLHRDSYRRTADRIPMMWCSTDDLYYPQDPVISILTLIEHDEKWVNFFILNVHWLNCCIVDGYSILHLACLHDKREVVRRLLTAGANVRLTDKDGNQPLHLAISHSHPAIIELLLIYGGNLFKKNKNNKAPLDIAFETKREGFVLPFISWLKYPKIHEHLCDVVVVALMNGRKTKTTSHECCLMWCSLIIETCEVQYLNAIFNVIEHQSEDTLHLWSKGVRKCRNVKNQFGNTLLHYACFYNSTFMTKLLLDLKVNNVHNNEGDTPLHVSCMNGHIEVTKLLLNMGLNAYTENKEGHCPLACACAARKLEIVNLLLKHGVHPNCTSNRFDRSPNAITPSQWKLLPINVTAKHFKKAVPLLLQHGAYVNICSSNGSDSGMDTPHMKIISSIQRQPIGHQNFWHFNLLSEPSSHKDQIVTLCQLISAGARIYTTEHNSAVITRFERTICSKDDEEFVQYLAESGYRFRITLNVPKYLDAIQIEPYSLQCLSAQNIRTRVLPNAWVGVKMLPLPKILKKYIVMNSSHVDVE